MKYSSHIPVRTKKRHMDSLAEFRDHTLRVNPILHHLFLEVTTACNERCRHCGSRCGESGQQKLKTKQMIPGGLKSGRTDSDGSKNIEERLPLTTPEYKSILDQIKKDFDISRLNLCITGGEPLLNPDLYEIMDYAHKLGFMWGMTTNGTLIDRECADKLAECGMLTVSVSVDGLKDTHDWFRCHPGAYELTMSGIANLLDTHAFRHVQVTTVVHRRNIDELEQMYGIISDTGVRSWRVINVDPIGRAGEDPELMLTDDELRRMFDFIRRHRASGPMEVTYGCSHYLGPKLEREVRPWYFLCNAGIYSASIDNCGDIIACLDIPRRPELVQGNIRRDRFKEVWGNGYEIFRTDYRKKGKCADCRHYSHCAGDSFHTWDFDAGEPGMCMKGILFDR